jgi:hypothetical protein
MDNLLALYVHNGCRFFYDLNCNMILIFKSRISQNFVVIRLQVLIVNLWTFQSFPFSGLNFSVNIFIFSSLMTSNILYKTYFKSRKKIKFSLSNCCNKGHALFLSTTVIRRVGGRRACRSPQTKSFPLSLRLSSFSTLSNSSFCSSLFIVRMYLAISLASGFLAIPCR